MHARSKRAAAGRLITSLETPCRKRQVRHRRGPLSLLPRRAERPRPRPRDERASAGSQTCRNFTNRPNRYTCAISMMSASTLRAPCATVSVMAGAALSATATIGFASDTPNQMTHSNAHTSPGTVSPIRNGGSSNRRAGALRPIASSATTAIANASAKPSTTRSSVAMTCGTSAPRIPPPRARAPRGAATRVA